MELPNCGIQCSLKGCSRLDFLPFTCSYCSCTFCKEHFLTTSHFCSKLGNNSANATKIIDAHCCSQELCLDKSVVEIKCATCNKHYCIKHRYHGCSEKSETEKLVESQKYEKQAKDFIEAKKAVDAEIEKNLKKSKNLAIARKVQLMKLKGKSIGPKNIPISERCYFFVHVPINSASKISKGAFVSSQWNVGKVIDSLANSLDILNYNNITNAKKLRIFHYITGNIISNEMDTKLFDLLNNNHLVNGEEIILEYSNDDKIDNLLYK